MCRSYSGSSPVSASPNTGYVGHSGMPAVLLQEAAHLVNLAT